MEQLLQQQFAQLAATIVRKADNAYHSKFLADDRLKVIEDMGNELEALRKAWEKMTGQKVATTQFHEALQIPSLTA